MLLKMLVPSPGESISEVEIAEWLVEDGDYVEKDQTIAEIDSDKATLELPAEQSGMIKIVVKDGETVAVGDVVCIIDTDAIIPDNINNKNNEKKKEPLPSPSSNKKNAVKKTPLADVMIKKNNIEQKDIIGSGDFGKITKNDVLNIINRNTDSKGRSVEFKKMTSLRRKIASRLVTVKNETAMLTTFNEVDMSAVMNLRAIYKKDFITKHNINLGFMSFFSKAVTKAIIEFPDINAMVDSENIVHYSYVDLAIAVSSPKGLMVPVIRSAEKLTFREIESEIKRLALKVRDGKITIDEMLNGTFTITNGGVFGSMLSTPIINPPQSAILGMHNIVDRAIVIDGKVVVRPIMYLALSYDHRIIDGKSSVGFLCKVKEFLENPEANLMDNNIRGSLEL
ncbi:MAG: 2-oxoglutarate dehydrogenase complex dihydrolipoyllysine-residue succinyltransferase [Flavobacteriales bacterium]|jgi:2-oxoglutarate dehydrogenase E2 component (dihydrolipoamide succinyltransferase)|nr:2-oxoglutarate dehydrogenase complex dihydrolipoyllysine-residue succinyltransferase [Flavobacteriales bacterium]